MRGAGITCYEYILEQQIEGSSDLVDPAGVAPVNVQGYHGYPAEVVYVNMLRKKVVTRVIVLLPDGKRTFLFYNHDTSRFDDTSTTI